MLRGVAKKKKKKEETLPRLALAGAWGWWQGVGSKRLEALSLWAMEVRKGRSPGDFGSCQGGVGGWELFTSQTIAESQLNRRLREHELGFKQNSKSWIHPSIHPPREHVLDP